MFEQKILKKSSLVLHVTMHNIHLLKNLVYLQSFLKIYGPSQNHVHLLKKYFTRRRKSMRKEKQSRLH